MEPYINFLATYFQSAKFSEYDNILRTALSKYLGLNEVAALQEAMDDFLFAFSPEGTGINEWKLTPIEDGEYRLSHHFEFTIKAKYIGFVPLIAAELGYGK